MKRFGLSICLIAFLLSSCGPDKGYLINFANTLYSAQVSDEQQYKELTEAIRKGKIANSFDILGYCQHATVLDARTYAPDIETKLEEIFHDISKVYPGLEFTDFKKIILADSALSDNETEHYNYKISLNIKGKNYEHTFFCKLMDKASKNYSGSDQLDPGMAAVFNCFLTDQKSDYQLYAVYEREVESKSLDKFGVIALSNEQALALQNSGSEIFMLWKIGEGNSRRISLEPSTTSPQTNMTASFIAHTTNF
ncbi:MAG: hypothetical protein ACJ77K_08510 [Bacteroidia bacterium]